MAKAARRADLTEIAFASAAGIERCPAAVTVSHLPLTFMTPHQKAVNAINARLERLQANLRDAKEESAQRFLFQSIVVTLGVAEALNDYIKMVGEFARRRHGELKQTNETLGAQHADLLKSGQELLEKLKANPTDRALRKEIERAQQNMTAVQKTLRRAGNSLQRDLAPSLALIDEMAVSVRRLSEADDIDALKRLLKAIVGQVREFYASQPSLPGKRIVDAAAWEKSVVSEIDQAAGFYDAYARAGFQATVALEMMTLAVAEHPPGTAEEATERANQAVAVRLKEITTRLTTA
jgi:hypothetical protein